MDKQKQIEEIAWIIQNGCNNGCSCSYGNGCEFKDNNFKKIYDKRLECENVSRAIKIYNTLIPEGSVVLSKEEYNDYINLKELLDKGYFTSENRATIHKVRKQAVKEVIDFIEVKDKKAGPYSIYMKLLAELKERYGVEL